MEEFNDPEYTKLKKDISERSYNLNIKTTIAVLAFVGAAVLGMASLQGGALAIATSSSTGMVAAGAGVITAAILGATSIITGVRSHKERVSLELDVKDLDAQRRAKHLKASFGDKSPNSDLLKMMENGHQDNVEAQQKWAAALEAERSAQQMQMHTHHART